MSAAVVEEYDEAFVVGVAGGDEVDNVAEEGGVEVNDHVVEVNGVVESAAVVEECDEAFVVGVVGGSEVDNEAEEGIVEVDGCVVKSHVGVVEECGEDLFAGGSAIDREAREGVTEVDGGVLEERGAGMDEESEGGTNDKENSPSKADVHGLASWLVNILTIKLPLGIPKHGQAKGAGLTVIGLVKKRKELH